MAEMTEWPHYDEAETDAPWTPLFWSLDDPDGGPPVGAVRELTPGQYEVYNRAGPWHPTTLFDGRVPHDDAHSIPEAEVAAVIAAVAARGRWA